MTTGAPACFPEPPAGTDQPARWSGGIVAWLERSSVARAGRARAFLNRHLDAIPPDAAVDVCRRLHDRDQFDRALFELLAGRFLQLLGADLDYAPTGAGGRAVDWRATFADGSVTYLEATSPTFDKWADTQARDRLLDILELETPAGWSVAVVALPRIGLDDRVGSFRAAVRTMFAGLPEPQRLVGDKLNLTRPTDLGRIELVMFPFRDSDGAVVMASGGAGMVDTPARVAAAVRNERKVAQARAFPGQVVLALGAGRFPHRREALDHALFGTVMTVLDDDLARVGEHWQPSGVLAGQARADFQAVLVFPGLGLGGGDDPIVYHHPHGNDLPAALGVLEQRRLGPDGVIVTPASRTGIVAGLGFPRMED